ncbi:hypothetical protein ACKI1O_54095, partial [Streptomyces scabiei]
FSCNVSFLHNLANHQTFKQGAPDTHFIEEQGDALISNDAALNTFSKVIAAFCHLTGLNSSGVSPWDQLSGFMLNHD